MERDRDADLPEQVMWEGRFITAKKRGRWEYVGRARGIRAAAIIALDADADGTRRAASSTKARARSGVRIGPGCRAETRTVEASVS